MSKSLRCLLNNVVITRVDKTSIRVMILFYKLSRLVSFFMLLPFFFNIFFYIINGLFNLLAELLKILLLLTALIKKNYYTP